MNDNMSTQFKRGTLDMILLSLIANHGCNYGYTILDALSEIGGVFFENPKPGTVYPVLYRLAKEGYIEAVGQDVKGGPARKLYAITEKGKERLADDISSWKSYNKVVDKFISKK